MTAKKKSEVKKTAETAPKTAETAPKTAEKTSEEEVIQMATSLATGNLNFSQVAEFLGNFLSDNEIEEISKKHSIYSENVEKISEIDNEIADLRDSLELVKKSAKKTLENQISVLEQQKTGLKEQKVEAPKDFQQSVDKFFLSGLNGEKSKSMLVLTEAEAAVSGTAAVNYFFRQALLEKQTKVQINQKLLADVTRVIGKHYISKGHVKAIRDQLSKTDLVKSCHIKDKTLYIQYN